MSNANLAVCLNRFGVASEVAELVALEGPGDPAPDQVLVKVLAAPIDPGHLLMFEGKYGLAQAGFPIYAGNQASGVVLQVGAAVTDVRVGDQVLLGDGERGTWRQRLNVAAANVLVVPDVDPLQLSLLLSTMTTAFCLVTRKADLHTGEWLLQNAANSAVGLQVARLARHLGVRSANIVRSEVAAQVVLAHGGDAVFLSDASDLRGAVTRASGGKLPRHAFDALAGSAVGDLAQCLADDGVVTSYGALTRAPYSLETSSVLFRGVRLQGFWRTRWAASTPRPEVRAVYEEVAQLLADGVFEVPIEATYDIREIRQALVHAARPGRSGKIVLLPNP
jgi:trans-2-enoyl-CoA reductase